MRISAAIFRPWLLVPGAAADSDSPDFLLLSISTEELQAVRIEAREARQLIRRDAVLELVLPREPRVSLKVTVTEGGCATSGVESSVPSSLEQTCMATGSR